MREHLESLLLVLAVGAVVAIAAKRANIAYNVALVVVGLLLVFADVLPHAPMDPEVVLVVFLPLLVFEGALMADAGALRRASRPILALAIPGVAISLLGTAGVAAKGLGLPFSAALLLGALLAITDTVSVLLAFRSVRVPSRLAAIMEGESLFNDGTALVLVSVTTGIVASGRFDLQASVRELVLAMLGGVAVGVGFGAVGALVLRRTPDHLTAILASIVLVLATSLLAERVHASPVIAVVVAGLAVGREARSALEPARVLALQGFWETTGFCLNVILFLLVGMQIDARSLLAEAPSIGLAVLALHVGRAVAVYGGLGPPLHMGGPLPLRWKHVMVVGNVKGALSMAAALALPTELPFRERILSIVFGVTFVTLVTQALPFGRILVALGVTLAPADEGLERARARLVAARRGQAELDDLLAAGILPRMEHAERRATLQREVIAAELVLRASPAAGGLGPVDIAVLYAQKAAVLDAARRGLVGTEIAEEEAAAIDGKLLQGNPTHDD